MKSRLFAKKSILILLICFFALFVLSLSIRFGAVSLALNAAVIVTAFALSLFLLKEDGGLRFDPLCLLLTAALEFVLAYSFHDRLLLSRKLAGLLSRVPLDNSAVLWIVGIGCAAVSFAGVYLLFFRLLQNRRAGFLTAVILTLSFAQLQISSHLNVYRTFLPDLVLACANVLLLYLLFLFLFFLTRRRPLSLLITAVFVFVFSIVNYYVVSFHGSPLFPSEFANTGTALHVLSEYDLTPGREAWLVLLLFAFQLVLIFLLLRSEKQTGRPPYPLKRNLLAFGLSAVFVYLCILSPVGINRQPMWSWEESVTDNGFLCCSVCDIHNVLHPLTKPDGYDAERISIAGTGSELGEAGKRPHIILILNESFCDLGEYCAIETGDADPGYMDGYYDIPGAVYGHTASSLIGGGTNNSEFELLTSNSMHLLQTSAPFNYLDLTDLDANVVSYLKAQGYETTAMHCMDPTNYSRHRAYPDLGFDHVLLGEDKFTLHSYGKRKFLDRDNYADMISLFEQRTSSDPQFYYLLTYQNHGGYRQNDPSLDQIHVENDYGELTEQLSEYLTSVSLSARAFHELTDYFSAMDEPVVICMLGDHAPSFIAELPEDKVISPLEADFARRSVPFVIWSNFDLALPADLDEASMVDLMPLILRGSGLPLTTYYESILSLHDLAPLRLYNGMYIDRSGAVGEYAPDSPCYEAMSNYYYMEYNALRRGNDYRKELFTLDGSG